VSVSHLPFRTCIVCSIYRDSSVAIHRLCRARVKRKSEDCYGKYQYDTSQSTLTIDVSRIKKTSCNLGARYLENFTFTKSSYDVQPKRCKVLVLIFRPDMTPQFDAVVSDRTWESLVDH
jgi:hypothetical protein